MPDNRSLTSFTTTLRPFSLARHLAILMCGLATLAGPIHADEASWNAAIEADEPLHWFRFTESAGSATLEDSGSAGTDAQVFGNLILADEGLLGSGTAARFNSDGPGYAEIPGLGELTGDWTAECILLRSDAVADSQAILGSPVSALKLEQWQNSDRLGFTEYGVVDYTFEELQPGSTVVPTEQWVHLVFVRTESGTRVFMDGTLISENTAHVDLPRLYIGSHAGGDQMIGLLDEIVIYEEALSQGQISAHYAAIAGGAETDAVLEVNSPFLNLGTTPDDTGLVGTLTVTNGGTTSPLTITEVTITGPDADHFTVLMPSTLAPGESGEIEVSFETLGQQGRFTATVTLTSDALNPTQNLRVDAWRAIAGTVFHYTFPESYDGSVSTIVDLSESGEDARFADGTVSAFSAEDPDDPDGNDPSVGSLQLGLTTVTTVSTGLMPNADIAGNGGYMYDITFKIDQVDGENPTTLQKIIDYAGTDFITFRNATGELVYVSDSAGEEVVYPNFPIGSWHNVKAVFDCRGNELDGAGTIAGRYFLFIDDQLVGYNDGDLTDFGDRLVRPVGFGNHPLGGERMLGKISSVEAVIGVDPQLLPDPFPFVNTTAVSGEVPIGETTATFEFPLINLGNEETLTVSDITFGGAHTSYFSAGTIPASLAPDEAGSLTIHFDSGGEVGTFPVVIELASNDPAHPVREISFLVEVLDPSGLISHYPLDETSGTVAADASGSANDGIFGTMTGGNLDLGQEALATGSSIRVAPASGETGSGFVSLENFPLPASWSIAFWMQRAQQPGNAVIIFSGLGPTVGDVTESAFDLGINNATGELIYLTTGSTSQLLATTSSVGIDTTHHVVVTYQDDEPSDGSATRLRIYIDGALSGELTSGLPAIGTLQRLRFGARADDAAPFGYSGLLDDIQIYRKELPQEEVTFLFTNPGETLAPDDGGGEPSEDSDGDGVSDEDEAIAGTDPNDASDYLRVISSGRDEGEVHFTWSSVAGISYVIEYSLTLEGEWDPIGSLDGTGDVSEFTDTDETRLSNSEGFYRIRVEP